MQVLVITVTKPRLDNQFQFLAVLVKLTLGARSIAVNRRLSCADASAAGRRALDACSAHSVVEESEQPVGDGNSSAV